MYRAIAEGNWRKPLDLTLFGTDQGELLIPFSRHIHPLNSTTSDTYFPQYAKLPAELQLQILHFCDEPTLFQLMHTSRCMRTEAKKLFFSSPESWYRIHSTWLLDGGHIGHTAYDPNFLLCIERLSIHFHYMNEKTWINEASWNSWIGTEEEAVAQSFGGMNEGIQEFWRTVHRLFPRVKHIIIGDDQDRSDSHDNSRLPTHLFKKVAQMCPSSIDVSISLIVQADGSTNRRWKRILWRPVTMNEDTHTEVTQEWETCSNHPGPSILPPYKVFCGIVGKYAEYNHRVTIQKRQKCAIRVHRIAAMEKHHFDGLHMPFGCSKPNCNAWFEQPEEYTAHAIETGHDHTEKLPEPFNALFVENQARLAQLMDDALEVHDSLLEWLDEFGTEKRKAATEEVVHQLEHDPLYADSKPALEHPMLFGKHESSNMLGFRGAYV